MKISPTFHAATGLFDSTGGDTQTECETGWSCFEGFGVTEQTPGGHARPQLARRLTLPLLVLYGLGVTVGAGIYVLIGEIGYKAGVFSPYAFLLAALLIAPTTYSFAKLVTRFPVSAGEARYVEEGYRQKWLAIVIGLFVAAAGIVSSATISVGAIGYVQEFISISGPLLVILIILTFTGLAILGIHASAMTAAAITLIEVGGLVLIIGGGFLSDASAIWSGMRAPFENFELQAIGLISASAVLAFYAFIGFEDMVNVAEEVIEPEKIFPTAIALTLLVTMVLYFLVSTISISLVSQQELGNAGAPISLIAERTGLISPDLLSGVGVLAALNGILIQIIMASRVLYGLSRQAEMPQFLSYVHPKTHTPVTATVIVAAITLALALAFPLARLAETTSQITFVVFTLVNGALIAITLREAGWQLRNVPSVQIIAIPALGALGSIGLMLVSLPSNTQIGHGNIAVQIVGDGNTIVAGHPHLLLTRYETDRLSAEDIAEREPTQLLAARQRAIPTIGRDPLLNEYEAWLNNDAAISVRVLVGSAGRGKTRFGLDLCDRATTSDWQTGFATSAEIRRFRAQQNLAGWGWSKPVLLVVDYASSVSEELHGWLAELAQNHNPADPDVPTPPLRILLLDRTADASGGWLQMVYGRGGGDRDSIERLLDRPEPYVLPPIADMEDRRQLLTEMLAAQGTELLPPAAGEDAWFDQRLAELSWGGEPLFLMMAASLAAREDFASVLALARDDMALRIADDELARIDRIISTTDQPPAFVHHMVAMVTLCGGLNATLALEVIAEEEEALHHRLPSGPASCLELLQRVLPKIKNRLAPIEPDMIGEAILMRVWADVDDAAISQTLKRASDNKDCRAAIGETVIRAAQDYAIHGHVAPLVWLDALGASAANDLFILFELLDALPAETVELRERALSLTEKALDVLRKLPVDDEVYSQLLAGTLNNLSNRLVGLGRREDALAAIEEAVRIRRELAAARPDAFLPNLAMSLNNLSGSLDGMGRREDALAAIEEAARIYRDLAAARPDAFLPDLAGSLNNLSGSLDGLGRQEDALVAIEEAVRIYRELSAARPDAFLPDLAMSLNNLSGSLDGLGRREEALAAIEEAVRIYRELAAARPDAFLPDLATSCGMRGQILHRSEMQREAMASFEEGIRTLRELRLTPSLMKNCSCQYLRRCKRLAHSKQTLKPPEDEAMSLEMIAGEALGYVMGVLGKAGSKALEGVVKTGAEKLLAYLKTKLGDGPEAKALTQLQADPNNSEAEAQLKEALIARLDSDQDFAKELNQRVETLQQAINVSNEQKGDQNKSAQIVGDKNKAQDEPAYLSLVRHYESCLETHGPNHMGVDWPNEEDLKVRFDVMLGVIAKQPEGTPVSLLDLGCGPGLLVDHLAGQQHADLEIRYQGIDVSGPMIEAARARHPDHEFTVRNVLINPIAPQSVDYVVMNGVMTEKRDLTFETMETFATDLIAAAFHSAKKGIAFNVMSPYVDWQRDDLFHWPMENMMAAVQGLTRHVVTRRPAAVVDPTVESDLVVIGGGVGCLVAALSAAETGAHVTLLAPRRGIGAGFASLEQDGFQLDIGCRRFDLTNDPVIGALEDYQPGVRTRPFANHYRSFVEDHLGIELVATNAPQVSYDGRRASDFVTSLDLTSLPDLLSADDVARIEIETDAILSANEPSPLTLGLGTWPDLSKGSLKDASIANHGPTFHARFIEPFARKLYPDGWDAMPADLASKIWAPLFFPRTVNQGCRREINRDRPAVTYFYPASGYFGEFVAKLITKIRRMKNVQIVPFAELTSIKRQGLSHVAEFSDRPAFQWHAPFALSTSLDTYFALAGKPYQAEKLSLAVIWVEVNEDDLLSDPAMINVFDRDTSVSRISFSGRSQTAGRRVLALEMTGGSSECSPDGARNVLTRMNILRPGANITHIRQEQDVKIPAPSATNRRNLNAARASSSGTADGPVS
eukprot:s1_g1082.t1